MLSRWEPCPQTDLLSPWAREGPLGWDRGSDLHKGHPSGICRFFLVAAFTVEGITMSPHFLP